MSPSTPAKQAAFHRKALSYDAHAFVQRDAAEWLAQWLPEEPHPGNCLELGAGTGLFTSHLQGRFTQIEISDASSEMLEVCNSRVPGLRQRARDAWLPQADPQSWDCVVSSSLLQWAPEPSVCLGHWKQLLRPNGRVLAGFFTAPSLPEMTQLLDGGSPVQWRSPDEWHAFFQAAGLRVERIEIDTRRYTYESPLHFWKSLHGTGATVSQRLTPSQMLRLLKDYESRYTTPDGGVYATWTFCRVELS